MQVKQATYSQCTRAKSLTGRPFTHVVSAALHLVRCVEVFACDSGAFQKDAALSIRLSEIPNSSYLLDPTA